MKCRFCSNDLSFIFIDLVSSPPSNSFLTKENLNEPEILFPLKLYLCESCFLVQIEEYKKSNEIFNEKYAYFSSFSSTWLAHAKNYVGMIIKRFKINNNSFVVEVASNDGYLLQYFVKNQIPCLGIEPASNTAAVAREKGIQVIEDYFAIDMAMKLIKKYQKPNLILGNNVLAHVPNINDFIKGLRFFLNETGVITMEFPHLLNLIEKNQFDTIYHEHFSYFSFSTAKKIFEKHGLEIFDVEEIPTHGGSLRIYVKHKEDLSKEVSENVRNLLDKEILKRMDKVSFYENFQAKVDIVKYELIQFLISKKNEGKQIIAYGAAAKGNTLLNYCGIKNDLIDFVVDLSPHKQGKYLPASHIPIVSEEKIKESKPAYVLILAWNLKEEIMKQLHYINDWGGKFVIPIPKVKIL